MADNTFLWLPASAVEVQPSDRFVIQRASMGMRPDGSSVMRCTFTGTLKKACPARGERATPAPGTRSGPVITDSTWGPIPQGSVHHFTGVGTRPLDLFDRVWYRLDPSFRPNVPGWATETGFRAAETVVQKGVSRVISGWPGWQAGAESRDSLVGEAAERSAHDPKGSWETDVHDGTAFPGQQLITLLGKVRDWYGSLAEASQPQEAKDVPNDKRKEFEALIPYWGTDAPELVTQALTCFLAKKAPVPTTDNGVLDYLEFRADCKETADRLVQSVKGVTHRYSDASRAGVLSIDVRPGMYAYYSKSVAGGLTHTMLVSDAYWDSYGQLKQLKIAESNKGGGWGHPHGMVPWKRRRWKDRVVRVGPQEAASRRMLDLESGDNPRYYLVVDSGS